MAEPSSVVRAASPALSSSSRSSTASSLRDEEQSWLAAQLHPRGSGGSGGDQHPSAYPFHSGALPYALSSSQGPMGVPLNSKRHTRSSSSSLSSARRRSLLSLLGGCCGVGGGGDGGAAGGYAHGAAGRGWEEAVEPGMPRSSSSPYFEKLPRSSSFVQDRGHFSAEQQKQGSGKKHRRRSHDNYDDYDLDDSTTADNNDADRDRHAMFGGFTYGPGFSFGSGPGMQSNSRHSSKHNNNYSDESRQLHQPQPTRVQHQKQPPHQHQQQPLSSSPPQQEAPTVLVRRPRALSDTRAPIMLPVPTPDETHALEQRALAQTAAAVRAQARAQLHQQEQQQPSFWPPPRTDPRSSSLEQTEATYMRMIAAPTFVEDAGVTHGLLSSLSPRGNRRPIAAPAHPLPTRLPMPSAAERLAQVFNQTLSSSLSSCLQEDVVAGGTVPAPATTPDAPAMVDLHGAPDTLSVASCLQEDVFDPTGVPNQAAVAAVVPQFVEAHRAPPDLLLTRTVADALRGALPDTHATAFYPHRDEAGTDDDVSEPGVPLPHGLTTNSKSNWSSSGLGSSLGMNDDDVACQNYVSVATGGVVSALDRAGTEPAEPRTLSPSARVSVI